MRRILLLLSLIAVAVGFQACAADAPAPTPPGGNGNNANSALQVRLFTNNANPTAGFCATIQAIVTLNGANVPDGTGVIFSTDFGTFEQSGTALVSVVTTNGTALTALCSTTVGVAKVKASATVGTSTASASIGISFQPSAQAIPFFAFCNPSSGPNTGGTSLTITGGRFFGDATTTRVQFTALGITREGVMQSVTATTLTVLTPAFPEAASPSVPVDIAVTFGTNTGAPITLAVPNCFVYGTASSDQPTITAVLPSTGSNDGGTRVTIIGSGFIPPIQVFFGTVEAPPPVSVTYNQIVVLSPAASGPGLGNLNATVGIRVRNTVSGKDNTLSSAFTFVTKLQLTAVSSPNIQRIDAPFQPITIFGNGFSSPMAVSLAGIAAAISSVSATELVVIPGFPLLSGCKDVGPGEIVVTNVNNGDSAHGLSFTYAVAITAPVITSVTTVSATPGVGSTVTIHGFNFEPGNVAVLFGTIPASVTSATSTTIVVTAPNDGKAQPACVAPQITGDLVPVDTVDVTVTDRSTGCTVTAKGAFTYFLTCL